MRGVAEEEEREGRHGVGIGMEEEKEEEERYGFRRRVFNGLIERNRM